MKKTVDISKYINADVPEFVLFGKTYAVKNDKKTILLLNEMRRKAAESNDDGLETDEKILALLIGEEQAKEVLEIINNSANYAENEKALILNVLALATGQEYEEILEKTNNALPR